MDQGNHLCLCHHHNLLAGLDRDLHHQLCHPDRHHGQILIALEQYLGSRLGLRIYSMFLDWSDIDQWNQDSHLDQSRFSVILQIVRL